MPTLNVLSNNKKSILKNHLDIKIFTAVKYCCILHGRIRVMMFQRRFDQHSKMKKKSLVFDCR